MPKVKSAEIQVFRWIYVTRTLARISPATFACLVRVVTPFLKYINPDTVFEIHVIKKVDEGREVDQLNIALVPRNGILMRPVSH